MNSRDFPGGLVVETSGFQCRSMGSIPDGGTKILHVAWKNQKKKKVFNKSKKRNVMPLIPVRC